jgi:TRAP-type C4-dicarboxylate transport system permease small subunit
VAAAVLLALIVLIVLVDVFGRLLVDSSFRISDLMLGTLIGALLLLVGIDVAKRWPINGGGGK